MNIDFVQSVNIVKELGGLGLLLIFTLWGLPKIALVFMSLAQAVDRNTRMIYHIAAKLGVNTEKGSDILREMPPVKP